MAEAELLALKAKAEKNVMKHLEMLERNCEWPSPDVVRTLVQGYDVVNLLEPFQIRQYSRRIQVAEIRRRMRIPA
ncbi:hypothetical protein [Pseudomonas sp. Marseille-QA0892]